LRREPLNPEPELSPIVAATGGDEGESPTAGAIQCERARAFAQPLLVGHCLDTGEEVWEHACGVAEILREMGAGPSTQAAAYLVYAGDFLQQPRETVARAFGEPYADLVELTRRLVQVQRATRDAAVDDLHRAQQTERVRKMLLAFSRDLRVVLLRLASRLQTLRWHARARNDSPRALAQESLEVFAALANRLGIWQIKWELEDLSFRFLQPEAYRQIAAQLDDTRRARELDMEFLRHQLGGVLRQAGLEAQVQGRPKHIYSIWKKMQGKALPFERVLDVRAVRVITPEVASCYAALAAVHARFRPVAGEYDDYIARPKPNGYQSLHTVVLGDDNRPMEVQIRTRSMHEHAEHGVAAHWAYKEAGTRGYAGASAASEAAERVAEARKAVMRQLLAWEREFAEGITSSQASAGDERIYVLTPQSTIVELSRGATPIDFAYALHTELGHRCRGARVDGALVPLNRPLTNGQTVEVVAARDGGPSMDWLNPELGYLHSPRSRAKVRAWFNAQAQAQTVARGRESVEKLLQREGKTAIGHEDLAHRLGFKSADALFEVVGKDEMSLRQIEALLRPAAEAPTPEPVVLKRSRASAGGVLVVGIDSLMTSLARCCRPAPPDSIGGFVTRGKGVAVHRAQCSNFRHMAAVSPDRIIPVTWGDMPATSTSSAAKASAGRVERLYPLDVRIEASDRQGLLRDISEVFARERVNVTGVQTRSVKEASGSTAHMTFTVELADATRLRQVLGEVASVSGVRSARRL
jgi:GTP pyrophosphokinase